jgi:hypothetical protein
MKAACAASKQEVSVDMIVAVIQARGNEYHSVAAQKKSVAALTAFGVRGNPKGQSPPPPPPPPAPPEGKKRDFKSKQACWNFKRATGCYRGTKCRFAHEGKPGVLSESRHEPVKRPRPNRLGSYTVCPIRTESRMKVSRVNVSKINSNNRYSVLEVQEGDTVCLGTALAAAVEPASPPKAAPPILKKQFSPGESERFEAYLVQRASGRISPAAAKSLLLAGVQVSSSSEVKAMLASGEDYVIADTGATVRVIGEPHIHLLINVRFLDSPITVGTADGNVIVDRIGDLPGMGGLMKGCLIIPTSKGSLLPIGVVCEELGAGFNISEGNEKAVFHKDGKVIQELEKVGSLHVVPFDSKDLETNKTDLVESVCIASTPAGRLVQELDAEQTALHLALVGVRCEGLENDPNRAIIGNNNSDSLTDSESLIRNHQGKVESCSSTGESGLMSHGANSNSLSGSTGAGGVIGHNSITGVSTDDRNSTDPEFRCEPCSNLAYHIYGCTVLSSKVMLEHRLNGHSDYHYLCPE